MERPEICNSKSFSITTVGCAKAHAHLVRQPVHRHELVESVHCVSKRCEVGVGIGNHRDDHTDDVAPKQRAEDSQHRKDNLLLRIGIAVRLRVAAAAVDEL